MYLNAGSTVTISNVTFQNSSAIGGNGNATRGAAGAGGFAGGGGGAGATTQGTSLYGGGSGTATAGGGGAALGGAIFIEDGATLNIDTAIAFSGSSLTAGSGGNPGLTRGADIFMMSGGQINVQNLTTNSSIPNPIESDIGARGGSTSSGGLILDGTNSATLTLNGANTYTGPTTVQSGRLYVNGSIITQVNVTGGVFGGNTSVLNNGSVPGSGNVTVSSGMLASGGDMLYGTMNIAGDLKMTGGGVFDLEVDSILNTDSIVVGGNAAVTGLLDIQAAIGNFLEGEIITVITTGGNLTGTFSPVISPILPNGGPLFDVIYTSNAMHLVVIADRVFAGDEQTINSGNPQHVVDYILSILPISPTSDLGFVVEALGLLSDKDVNKALNLMHPAAFGSFEWIDQVNNSAVMSIFADHLYELPCSSRVCSNQKENCRKNSVWIQPFGAWNSQGKRGQLRGFHDELAGVAVGYDHRFDQFILGGGGGYSYTNYRWKGSAGSGDINQGFAGVYSSYLSKYIDVSLATMLGKNYYNTKRNIFFKAEDHPGAYYNETAKSHFTGFQWTSRFGLLSDFNSFSVPLQVFAALEHFYLNQSRFLENGANGINLDVRKKISNMLKTQIGIHLTHNFTYDFGCFALYIGVGWTAKNPLSSSTYRSNFRGQTKTFRVNTTRKGSNQVTPSLGFKVSNDHGFSVLINSSADLNGKMKNYLANLRLEYTF